MTKEEIYYKIREISFRTAFSWLKNCEDSEDIAQTVCLKYLQNEEKIKDPLCWAKAVTKNEICALAKKRKKEGAVRKLFVVELGLNSNEESDTDKLVGISKLEVKKYLTKDEFQFFKLLVKYDSNSSKIAKHLNKSISYVYGLSYRVKRNIVARKYLSEGYEGSSKIIDYNLHQKILRFLQVLKVRINENNLQSMHKYFRDMDVEKIKPLHITETFQYEIRKIGISKFNAFIPYLNEESAISFLIIDFDVDKRNRITITKFNPNPSKVMVVEKPLEEILPDLTPSKLGLLEEKAENVEKVLKKHKAKLN